MIRITQIGNGSKGHLLVEGSLSDGWVDALEASWLEAQSQVNGKRLCIDLSGVTFVDDKGRELLSKMIRDGAEIRAVGIMTRTVVEELTTHLREERTNDSRHHEGEPGCQTQPTDSLESMYGLPRKGHAPES